MTLIKIDKEFTKRSDLVGIQKTRKLFKSKKQQKEFESILINNNYFDFINGFETLTLKDKNNKNNGYKNDISLNDFKILNEFDKNFRIEILSAIGCFEQKLKNSVSYHFAESHCNGKGKTLNYLKNSFYQMPSLNSFDYPKLSSMFNNHVFFIKHKDITTNMKTLDYVQHKQQFFDYLARYNEPPLWVIIKQLQFGELYNLTGILATNEINKVLIDFGLSTAEREYFLMCIDIISDLRNHCAHYEIANRFRTKSRNYNIIKNKHPNLTVYSNTNTSVKGKLRIYQTLAILNRFTSTRKIHKVIVLNHCNLIIRNKKWLAESLLDRMGEVKLSKWKNIR